MDCLQTVPPATQTSSTNHRTATCSDRRSLKCAVSLACLLVGATAPASAASTADSWNEGGAFNWSGPKKGSLVDSSHWQKTGPSKSGKSFNLTLDGFKSKASAPNGVTLTDQSTISLQDGASANFNHHSISFGSQCAIIVDGGNIQNVGPLTPLQKGTGSLDLILTSNSIVDGSRGETPKASPKKIWNDVASKHPKLAAIHGTPVTGNSTATVDTSSISGAATYEMFIHAKHFGVLFSANDWEIALEDQANQSGGNNQLVHIAYVVNPPSDLTKIYINGRLAGMSKDVPNFSSNKAIIGNAKADASNKGGVAAFAAYKGALSANEIANHASMTPAGTGSTGGGGGGLGGGTVFVMNSTLKLPSLVNAEIAVEGYGTITLTGSDDVIAQSTINMKGERTRVHFTKILPRDVIRNNLGKFSINGKLPIYGKRPDAKEAGDNIIIRSDRANGTIVVPINQ